ncbi:hypothetical protein BC936DRAFT_147096 [Jimgerdemannia flammicorona]|uniref:Uncharacterized protein n=1 Tax=Jimgerdemannia flammicorona TaxID=994334 RepID=A0A433D637_9FUNG|nr:hypothetical protein BC936DRAFT_147096 [Jimgerdemannia flammicorona]
MVVPHDSRHLLWRRSSVKSWYTSDVMRAHASAIVLLFWCPDQPCNYYFSSGRSTTNASNGFSVSTHRGASSGKASTIFHA